MSAYSQKRTMTPYSMGTIHNINRDLQVWLPEHGYGPSRMIWAAFLIISAQGNSL
jgi:hypothetical protein